MNFFEQALTNYFTKNQLKRIQAYTIGVGGAGGIGSNVAISLARCGFKKFVIIDFDDIEPSNLNRQQYFINEIGKNKVDALKRRIQKINPDANVTTHTSIWAPENNNRLFNTCDILIEGFDIAETKKQFVETYQDKVKYIICASGLAGLTTDNPLKIQKIKNIFVVGNQSVGVSPENPPLAPQIAICAGKMAEITLHLTLNGSFLE